MNIKHLRSFLTVAESGSLSAASDRLRVTQPALSRQIRLIETAVKAQLFERSGRGMQLTRSGLEFFERIKGLVDQLDKAIEEATSSSLETSGKVTFGMVPTVGTALASRLAQRVAHEFPEVSLRIVEGYGAHLIDWLHRGEVDVVMIYGPGADLHLRVTEILYEKLLLISSKSEEPRTAPVSLTDLASLRLVLPSRPHGLRTTVERFAEKKGASLRVKFEADSFSVLKDLVRAGLGHTILPRSALSTEELDKDFNATPITDPTIQRQMVMALPANRTESHATRAVIEIAVNEIANMIEAGEWEAIPTQDLLSGSGRAPRATQVIASSRSYPASLDL